MWSIVYRNLDIGGAESLVIRLSRLLAKKGLLKAIVADRVSGHIKNDLSENNLLPFVINFKSLKSQCKMMEEEDIILTFNPSDFSVCENFLKKTGKVARVFMYMLHTLATSAFFNRYLKKFDQFVNRNVMRNYISNGNILVMNDSGQKSLKKIYGICPDEKSVFFLPMEINKPDPKILENKTNKKECLRVLTVARSEFPFKGYMKRLIYAVSELSLRHSVHLTIVTSGKNLNQLTEWVDDSGANVSIFTDIKYNDLADFYQKAHVYVGMGTTILEASMYGIPSYATESYTYDCNVVKMFADDPCNIGTIRMNGKDVTDSLECMIMMSQDEYEDACCRSYKAVCDYYDIHSFVDKLENRQLNNIAYNRWNCFFFENIIRNIRYKKIYK